ncbi:MAG: hypothetical protein IJK64_00830 [Clostridia bacterium]|nr:hypothetical protein [Clostridia bacterium]
MERSKSAAGLAPGWLYFYVHFVTEVVCFFALGRLAGDSAYLWIMPLVYDALAFVPQSLIGAWSDRHPRCSFGLIGLALLSAASLLFLLPGKTAAVIALIVLCIGNACTHVNGAEVTLRSAAGHLAPSAIFVSGGSFGVITGRLLAKTALPIWVMAVFALTAIPFVLLAEYDRRAADKTARPCAAFRYASEKVPAVAVILVAVLIVIVRGYMGYGIPTAWKKTVLQTVLLYVAMGVGKAAGGLLADRFGVKRVALFSAAAALPFLLLGDEHMLISLIGVMFFSMTMSITLALLVSVLPEAPGLAFGLTTIGLFLGTAPIFFFKFTTVRANGIIIAALTLLCLIGMAIIIRKDEKRYV